MSEATTFIAPAKAALAAGVSTYLVLRWATCGKVRTRAEPGETLKVCVEDARRQSDERKQQRLPA